MLLYHSILLLFPSFSSPFFIFMSFSLLSSFLFHFSLFLLFLSLLFSRPVPHFQSSFLPSSFLPFRLPLLPSPSLLISSSPLLQLSFPLPIPWSRVFLSPLLHSFPSLPLSLPSPLVFSCPRRFLRLSPSPPPPLLLVFLLTSFPPSYLFFLSYFTWYSNTFFPPSP